jgi:sporulation protein YlmC with PRC-barrel domain
MVNEKKINQDNLTGKNHEGLWPNAAQYLTASSVIGDNVENSNGENLGKIKDVMLDIKYGKIEYVVLEFGGFMGFGEKLFAIPFNALKLNAKKQVFIVDWDKKILENAPGFNQNHWPETNKHYEEVNGYWGSFMGAGLGSDMG